MITILTLMSSCIQKRPDDANEKKQMFWDDFHYAFHELDFILDEDSNRGVATRVTLIAQQSGVTDKAIGKAKNQMQEKGWRLIRNENGFILFCKLGAVFELAEPSENRIEGGYFVARNPMIWVVGYKYHPETIRFCNGNM